MNSSENITKNNNEAAEKEVAPKSPELEVVSQEQFTEKVDVTESFVDKQAGQIVVEGEEMITYSANGMGLAPEMIQEVRHEEGLDSQLEEIQNEADKIAAETKAEISSVKGKDSETEQGVDEMSSEKADKEDTKIFEDG